MTGEAKAAKQARNAGKAGGFYVVLAVFVLFSALPFYVMLISTLTPQAEMFNPSNNPFWVDTSITLNHLELLFFDTHYLLWMWNTFVVGAVVVAITVVLVLPASYSLARLAGGWGEVLGIGIFLTYLVPPTLLFLPLSKVIGFLGLQNSMWSLAVIYPTFTIPFCTWLMLGFFRAIPKDIEEQAMIDGHSRLGAFLRAVLPLAVPGILTIIVFAFTLSTSEFIYALAYVHETTEKTISVGVTTELIRGDVYRWGSLLAGALIASIPVAILYTFFIDHFVRGLTAIAK